MSSRLWLAAAFVLAFGASPARAETDLIAVTLDQAKIAKLPAGATTLIIGNPMIADVTMLKNNNSMVITGKGFGQTNLIAIDAGGSIIEEKQVRVLPAKTVLVLQNGTSRISYACNPECMPTVQLGDDDKMFSEAGGQISTPQQLRCGRRGAGGGEIAYRSSRYRVSPSSCGLGDDQPALAEVFEMREGR